MVVRWKQLLRRYLPGIISGGADNDPSGIVTYSLSGALFGYHQLWLLLLSTPMLIAVQAMCARLGYVTKKGLMTLIKERYAPIFAWISLCILVVVNIATIAADLAAISESIGLIINVSYIYLVVPIALALWLLVVFKNYKTIEKFLFFLTFVFLSYVVSGFLARPDWSEVARALVFPKIQLDPSYLMAGLGLLGTTITPFLFFWQAKQEIEERRSVLVESQSVREDTRVAPGFIYSNIISFFIIVATAAVFHTHGIKGIETASDAARALEPFAGVYAKYLFAIGIIGAGLLAVPVLAASTGYVVAELFGWRDSLSDSPKKARGFYMILTISFLFGIGIVFSGIHPVDALLYSQVLGGILAPILILLILFLCNDKKVMGTYVNGWFDNIFGFLSVVLMSLGAVALLWQVVTTSLF
ncbi:Nramp family divalent metal transporter [Candidatus Gottesmanbacteria bacterium]|nr:Nramp family divalent metal transporter [Candidatus Gottesmanbacteria bacterium]